MLKGSWLLGFVVLFVFSGTAFADILLTPPTSNFVGAGAGGTRGDIITMTGDFSLTSIGIDGLIANGAQLTFSAYVYDDQSGIGVNPLAVGASGIVTGDGTEKFFVLPISFTLHNGQSYDIGIDFHSFNNSNLQINYYNFTASSPPFSVGPVTVLDGEESHNGPNNSLTPNLLLNGSNVPTVPEPGSLILMGTVALGIVGAMRRKRIG